MHPIIHDELKNARVADVHRRAERDRRPFGVPSLALVVVTVPRTPSGWARLDRRSPSTRPISGPRVARLVWSCAIDSWRNRNYTDSQRFSIPNCR